MKEVIMKTTICGAALLLSLTMASCEVYESPEINQGLNEENNTSLYTDAYDPISNVGQYYMPEMKVKPKKYWNCVEVVTVGSRNELGQTEKVRGLQYHLMCQLCLPWLGILGNCRTNRCIRQYQHHLALDILSLATYFFVPLSPIAGIIAFQQ